MSTPGEPARIFITGVGLVSPLGHSAWQTFRALLAGRSISDRAANLPDDCDAVTLVQSLGGVSVAQHYMGDPTIELAERAGREAMAEAGCLLHGEARDGAPPLPCIICASKGAMHALADSARRYGAQGRHGVHASNSPPSQGGAGGGSGVQLNRGHKDAGSPTLSLPLPKREGSPKDGVDTALAVALGPVGYLEHHLSRRLHVAPLPSVVAACASSLTAVHRACEALRRPSAQGAPKRVLVVTAEASLLPMFIHSYRRLGVLAPLTPAGYACRPLDEARCGFTLAQQGAAIVLERVEADEAPPPRAYAELLDTAIACDAFDLIRPAPHMPALAHVAERLLARRPIDMIHPHATATPEHDAAELAVYARKGQRPRAEIEKGQGPRAEGQGFGKSEIRNPKSEMQKGQGPRAEGRGLGKSEIRNQKSEMPAEIPQIYACKGALGHGLGAAGLVSLVIACLCARSARRPPMPWLTDPIASAFDLAPAAAPLPAASTHAIFAVGFGGHVAGVVLRGGR